MHHKFEKKEKKERKNEKKKKNAHVMQYMFRISCFALHVLHNMFCMNLALRVANNHRVVGQADVWIK